MYQPSAPVYQEIIDFVRKTGERLQERSGQITDLKQGKVWITEEDVRIERELTDLVLKANQQAKIYAEEEHSMFESGDEVWIIDPISHTFSFIHGLPHYAIVISRMIKGEIQFGLIYDVSLDELFVAERNQGTFLNNKSIKVSSLEEDWALIYDSHPVGEHKKADNLKILDKLMELGRVKAYGSMALHYAYVACGRVQVAVTTPQDAFPEFAGKLIVEEAGGLFENFAANEFSINDRDFIAAADRETMSIVRDKLGLKS